MNRKLGFEYLLERAENRVSISGQITEICLHGFINYLSNKLSFVISLFKNQDRLKKLLLSLGVWGFLRGEHQQKTHFKVAGGSADLKISNFALLSLNHHNFYNTEPIHTK